MATNPRPRPAGKRSQPNLRFRIRVMRDDAIALGPGKIDLLEAVREHGSISAAARSMNMSYRRAWLLMDELNQRKAVVFVHPSALPGNAIPGLPAYVADFLLDSVRAAVNLCRSGTMDRCPDIKFILSHGGGFLPFAAARVALHASPKRKLDDGIRLLRRFYFDTALASSQFAMPSLLAFADPTHVTYGSDFPYAPPAAGTMFTRALDAYRNADHDAINRGNVGLLFPRLANRAA